MFTITLNLRSEICFLTFPELPFISLFCIAYPVPCLLLSQAGTITNICKLGVNAKKYFNVSQRVQLRNVFGYEKSWGAYLRKEVPIRTALGQPMSFSQLWDKYSNLFCYILFYTADTPFWPGQGFEPQNFGLFSLIFSHLTSELQLLPS